MPTKIVISLDKTGENFLIDIPFKYNYLVQDLPERKWLKASKKWKVPATWRSREAMEPLKKYFWTDDARELFDAIEDRPVFAPPLEQNPDWYPFKREPLQHQWEAYRRAVPQDYYALFFEQGLGKCKTSTDIMGLWGVKAVIIVVPVSVLAWDTEWELDYPYPFEIQRLSTKKGADPVWKDDAKTKVLICGVESLSQGGAFEIAIRFCAQYSPGLIVDESTRIKNHKAVRTERVLDLADLCVKRLILTGTPVTQGVHDLYSQFQVLNPANLGLTSFYAFRNRYCVMGGFEKRKIVGYKDIPELMSLIEPWSLRREKVDCLDLPDKVFQLRSVELSPEQRKAYTELRKNLRTVIETEKGTQTVEVKMILEAYLRLQQICGGFFPIIDPETGETLGVEPIPGPNPKLNELMQLMDEIGDRKVVIWSRFRPEVDVISKALSNEREVVQFHGGLSKEEKQISSKRFQHGTANVLVATQQSGAYGNTWTSAHTAIYFSMGFSLEEYLQSQDRIHRIGQTISCDYTLLSCAGTVDSNVVNVLSDKKELADFISDRLQHGEMPF